MEKSLAQILEEGQAVLDKIPVALKAAGIHETPLNSFIVFYFAVTIVYKSFKFLDVLAMEEDAAISTHNLFDEVLNAICLTDQVGVKNDKSAN